MVVRVNYAADLTGVGVGLGRRGLISMLEGVSK